MSSNQGPIATILAIAFVIFVVIQLANNGMDPLGIKTTPKTSPQTNASISQETGNYLFDHPVKSFVIISGAFLGFILFLLAVWYFYFRDRGRE